MKSNRYSAIVQAGYGKIISIMIALFQQEYAVERYGGEKKAECERGW